MRASPANQNEELVKSRVLPKMEAGSGIHFVSVGKRTVDALQIRERFDALGTKVDWTIFRSIAEVPNEVEHYYADVTMDSLQGRNRVGVSAHPWLRP